MESEEFTSVSIVALGLLNVVVLTISTLERGKRNLEKEKKCKKKEKELQVSILYVQAILPILF